MLRVLFSSSTCDNLSQGWEGLQYLVRSRSLQNVCSGLPEPGSTFCVSFARSCDMGHKRARGLATVSATVVSLRLACHSLCPTIKHNSGPRDACVNVPVSKKKTTQQRLNERTKRKNKQKRKGPQRSCITYATHQPVCGSALWSISATGIDMYRYAVSVALSTSVDGTPPKTRLSCSEVRSVRMICQGVVQVVVKRLCNARTLS